MKSIFRLENVPEDLQNGLKEIVADFPDRFKQNAKNAIALSFSRAERLGEHGLSVDMRDGTATVQYGSSSTAFRGLGLLLGAAAEEFSAEERSAFTMRGLMIDCSRNGLLCVGAAKEFMRRVALMGVNMLMLYTEDTYEVPGEPFFGYLRGAYSHDELKELDDYADALGIELVPCIQTLGHMAQVLQWDPYFPMRENPAVLLPGDEQVYKFIQKLIRAASAPVRSRRIHLGMDEAHGVGEGRYKQIHGERSPFDVMNEHLARVRDLCRQEGLEPMIWSDMYFRLGSKTHDYYDLNWQMPAAAKEALPKDVQFVYWDYYHDDPAFYQKMIAYHRELGVEPIMGGGIWTWSVLWCTLPWSLTVVNACMTACRREGLKEVFMTMWGDNGMQVDIFSALPGIQYFCEQAFNEKADLSSVKAAFNGSCDAEFDDFMRAAEIESTPLVKDPAKNRANVAVALLWQDPLLAIMDPHTEGADLKKFYAEVAADLKTAAAKQGVSPRLRFPQLIAEALAHKVNLRRDLAAAYRAGDKQKLKLILKEDLPALQQAVIRLWKAHRDMWMATYKPFGWEVIEHRYGGLRARLETVAWLVGDYLDGKRPSIPELEAALHNPWAGVKDTVVPVSYDRVKTPSCIK